MVQMQPIKADLVADLVQFINLNLAELLEERACTCPDCGGSGLCGQDSETVTCATCNGVGAIARYVVNLEKLKAAHIGRYVEGFDVKHGQVVPKMRSKDKAFAMLIKMLGLDRAVLEVQHPQQFAESITDHQRAEMLEQLRELFAQGLLNG